MKFEAVWADKRGITPLKISRSISGYTAFGH